jgi:hypothetical protein
LIFRIDVARISAPHAERFVTGPTACRISSRICCWERCYEVAVIGDLSTHLCFIIRIEDVTFLVDPRQADGSTAALGMTLTRA